MTARESHLVELVDAEGEVLGSTTVEQAHRAPGQLHRAFSVFLRDDSGRVLLQQRAAVKTRFPLRWANTCCGHPGPGEDLAVAAGRRLGEELGLPPVPMVEVGVYAYYAEDPATGRVEYEYDHVLLGDLPAGARPAPDPSEVSDLRWVDVTALLDELGGDSRAYAPWLAGVTNRLAEHLSLSPSLSPSPPERSGGH
ncbi:isopentenyl-diphosphate Delta-isomerase [Paractinoplanes atraurantiacus]|uniref:Isopentenyl-diphosphate Delta-isomerase n=1 Tax=Paractinoplanes atraurantiacus TaxID=1036182 RepID=A0A285JWQ7_9ACTN|nr:isopentenyl-diphosphate Delta-isomerase [Actinoplanes atraurantiacus]SNY63726.1 isopentenyl-diphosphate delta-isomerase [Actinoplanes atraurantiacus]